MRVSLFGFSALAFLALNGSARAQGTQPAPSANAASAQKPKTQVAAPVAQVAKPVAQKPGKTAAKPVHADPSHHVATAPQSDDARANVESPELVELGVAERELFPQLGASANGTGGSGANASPTWPTDLPAAKDSHARFSGLPPAPQPDLHSLAEGGKDVAFLSKLDLPDLPVRWDAKVVRYIEFFKDDPRGRSILTQWLKHSGRYREAIRKSLRKKGMPEDLMYLAMIESGFESVARSPVGAMGVWQFMPETGRLYGLTQDRWVDQRLNVQAATEAAAECLSDLYRRFGTWDLAMAGYNMGAGGLLQSLRRYNTNDYWALARAEGSLPWETTLYVPKVLALAVIGKNLAAFGFKDVALDAPLEGQELSVPPQTALATIAQAASMTTKEISELNPELRAQRTPPGDPYPVRVPAQKIAQITSNLPRFAHAEPPTEKYTVRFGETLSEIALAKGTTNGKLMELNALAPGEVPRGGTVLLVPIGKGNGANAANANANANAANPNSANSNGALASGASSTPNNKPLVVVPQDVFVYPDRRRVFYRVIANDDLNDIAKTFKVTVDDIRRWNEIDPVARLVEGMTIQLFLPENADISHAVLLSEKDVFVVHAGSDEFFARTEDKGRKRIVVSAKPNETLEQVGKRFGVSASLMERINRKPRGAVLKENESVVVYVPSSSPFRAQTQGQASEANAKSLPASATRSDVEPQVEAMPQMPAPAPELLPPLPN